MSARETKTIGWLFALVVGASALLRVPGLATDFWLDEIWTLKIVLGMDSPWDVFTEVRHSNNHHLNTLFFYYLGYLDNWWIYRIHAVVAGIASVGLAFWLGARHGRTEGVVAGLLCATSYLLVHFSSEARGYALVLLFALGSFAALRDFPERRRSSQAALFWACACLGFLSHLMYLHVFAAAGVWMAVRLWRNGNFVPGLAQLFALPTLFLALFYWFDIRLTKIGDGPELDAAEVFIRALSYAIGGPPSGIAAYAVAAATGVLFAGAVAWWARDERDEWLFLGLVIFVSPTVMFLALQPDVFFVRYFLLSTVFGLLALAAPLARALDQASWQRAVAAALIAFIVIGNGVNLARFYRYGRGDYLGTVRFIAEAAGSQLPTVAGDHRFRNRNLILYYNRFLPPDRRIVYQEQSDFPDWLLLHRIGELGPVEKVLARNQHRYTLERVARYSDLSGWHWLLYRKQR